MTPEPVVSLEGRVAIVTGAAGGLGEAYCRDLAAHGAAVVANDMDADGVDAVVSLIREQGGTATPSYETVATREGGAEIVHQAVNAFGTVDVVVNNAGFLRNGYFEDITGEQLDAVLDVHLKAAFYVTQPAWPVMQEKHYGRVILTSSSSGMFSHQGLSNYAAAKAGLYGLCKALAFEGAPHGIFVNALLPSAVTTIEDANPIPGMDEYRAPDLQAVIAGKRTPGVVAPLVTFLASEACVSSGEAFAAQCGHYARVFVGVGPGWLADGLDEVTANDIASHIDEIRVVEPFTVPKNNFEHNEAIISRIRAGSGA